MLIQILPKAHQTYRRLPILGPMVDEFTKWAHQRGFTLSTLEMKLGHIRHMARFFQRIGLRHWQELTRKHFDAAWESLAGGKKSMKGTVRQVQRFLQEIHGLVLAPPEPTTRVEAELMRLCGVSSTSPWRFKTDDCWPPGSTAPFPTVYRLRAVSLRYFPVDPKPN